MVLLHWPVDSVPAMKHVGDLKETHFVHSMGPVATDAGEQSWNQAFPEGSFIGTDRISNDPMLSEIPPILDGLKVPFGHTK